MKKFYAKCRFVNLDNENDTMFLTTKAKDGKAARNNILSGYNITEIISISTQSPINMQSLSLLIKRYDESTLHLDDRDKYLRKGII